MDSYLTPRQLAAQWQVSIKTIYRLVAQQKLRVLRLPGCRLLRFDPSQLAYTEQAGDKPPKLTRQESDEFVARCEQEQTPPVFYLQAWDNALAEMHIYQGDAIVVQSTKQIAVGDMIAYDLADGRTFIARCFEKTAQSITIGLQSPINTFELSSIQIRGRVLGFDAFAGIDFLALEDEGQTGD